MNGHAGCFVSAGKINRNRDILSSIDLLWAMNYDLVDQFVDCHSVKFQDLTYPLSECQVQDGAGCQVIQSLKTQDWINPVR